MEKIEQNQKIMGEEQYITDRVDNQLRWYSKESAKAKKRFIRLQSVVIVLGVLVPVIINLPTELGGFDLQLGIRIAATVCSLTLAIIEGLLNFRKWGDLWLSYRMTAELLKHEKHLFLTRSGRYEEKDTAFSVFVQTIESVISSEHNRFRTIIEEARRPKKQDGTPAEQD